MKNIKKVIFCILVSCAAAAALHLMENNSFYRLLDLKLYDLQMTLRKQPPQDKRILFVEMDDETIDNLGRWPWPRDIFANITNTLKSLGARQVLFDVTFAQPGQMIIEKESIDHIFKGKDQISTYIENEKGVFKSNAAISTKNIIYSLDQIQSGLKEYTRTAEEKLLLSVTDNDKVLTQSFQGNKTFIGYSFEIVTNPQDIQTHHMSEFLKLALLNWIRHNPEKPFTQLPLSLSKPEKFNTTETRTLFLRAKLLTLIEKNIELSGEQAASALDLNPEVIRPEFNLAKSHFIKRKLLNILKKNPDAQLTDAIYALEVFDIPTQNIIKTIWDDVKKESVSNKKFGLTPPVNQGFLEAIRMEPPHHIFSNAVHNGGFLNGIPDDDGVLRSVPLFIRYQDKIFPHIGMSSILSLYKPKKISYESNKFLILNKAQINNTIKNVRIPIDENGLMLINWAGPWKESFRHISAAEIYRLYYHKNSDTKSITANALKAKEKELRNTVKDSICIIGLTAAGTHDFNPIPYESTYPMVGTHGNVINAILTEQFITKADNRTNTLILFGLALILGLSLPWFSSLGDLLISLFLFSITCFTSLHFFEQGLSFNLASPCLLILISWLGITSYKFSTETKDKREIKKAFSKYVSPAVIEEIAKDPSKLQLGGIRRELTVLFSDIRSFTTYSEKRKPEEVVTILNEYLDAMTRIVFECNGTLDKYVGDEIMAIFGAPNFEPPEINARRAVITAMKMLDTLATLHDKWKNDGLEPLDIGIGINTGEMVVGNMGSNLRMDYTVIGDAVNLGARVEALTRDFDAHLIITEATFNYVKDMIEYTPLEPIKVKGKDIPVMIYKVTKLKSDDLELC